MTEVQTEERRELPCAFPDKVSRYVSIEQILDGNSGDFDRVDLECECERLLCEHALDYKRGNPSYRQLVEHFRNGGMVNQPLYYDDSRHKLHNGHHRLIAALDAGFTHVPVWDQWGDDWDWREYKIENLIEVKEGEQ